MVVNVDRTTQLDFRIAESAIEIEALTVMANRPVVEQDVTSSQVFIDAEKAQNVPVNTLLDAMATQPGISVVNRTQISVRGSTPDEISFQVDGFEQTNPLENRSYTSMNQALVQEVQVLTGAFTAEYSSRAAVINVVTKDPGPIPTFSGDVRGIPARQQHFGPSAYSDDQFDRLLYSNDGSRSTNGRMFNWTDTNKNKTPDAGEFTDAVNSNKPVYLADMTTSTVKPELTPSFLGWDSLAVLSNKGTYGSAIPIVAAHKGFWTAAGLQEVWDWQHRGTDYTGDGDYFVDVAATIPLYGVPRTGLVLGYQDTRAQLPYPAAVQAFTDRVFEGTLKSSIIPAIKIEARGRMERVHTTVGGGDGAGGMGGSRDLEVFSSGDQSQIVAAVVGGRGSVAPRFRAERVYLGQQHEQVQHLRKRAIYRGHPGRRSAFDAYAHALDVLHRFLRVHVGQDYGASLDAASNYHHV